MKIVTPSSGSLTALTGESGKFAPQFSPRRPEQEKLRESSGVVLDTEQYRAGAVDQQASQIDVPALADAVQCLFATGRVLSRHHANPSREVASATKSRSATVAAINVDYANFLTAYGIDPSDPGIAVGAQAAAGILALRANDGRFPANPPPFIGNNAIGQWRPTPSFLPPPPPSFAAGLTPWLANVTPFTMRSNSQFRVDPPPDLTSETWAEDYNETKAFGAFNSTVRTPEQTDIGYFWADNGPLFWQNALRFISSTYLNNIGDSARMFALAETALADAQIACRDSKYFYNFWRPVTAIPLGDLDGSPATDADPNWQPLINTPNFPEYPSGHASISGAISRMLRLFFGTDEVSFQMTKTNPHAQQTTRTFSRFSEGEDQVINARVYVGIHYRNSDKAARSQGLRVADWVFKNYFRPIGDPRFGQWSQVARELA